MIHPIAFYRRQFSRQKARCKDQGVGFNLTFDQWVAWWGNDIDRRGIGYGQLQMLRIACSGGFSLGNIKKGSPSDRGKTRSIAGANRRSEKAMRQHQAELDALMFEDSKDGRPYDDRIEDEMKLNGHVRRATFLADKR